MPATQVLLYRATYAYLPVFVHAALNSGVLDCFFSCLFCFVCFKFIFLMLRKDCERTEREFNRKKGEPLLLMAGPNVNRKLKVWKETSLRLRWSKSSYCNDAFALIFLFPTTLEELINILSLKIT